MLGVVSGGRFFLYESISQRPTAAMSSSSSASSSSSSSSSASSSSSSSSSSASSSSSSSSSASSSSSSSSSASSSSNSSSSSASPSSSSSSSASSSSSSSSSSASSSSSSSSSSVSSSSSSSASFHASSPCSSHRHPRRRQSGTPSSSLCLLPRAPPPVSVDQTCSRSTRSETNGSPLPAFPRLLYLASEAGPGAVSIHPESSAQFSSPSTRPLQPRASLNQLAGRSDDGCQATEEASSEKGDRREKQERLEKKQRDEESEMEARRRERHGKNGVFVVSSPLSNARCSPSGQTTTSALRVSPFASSPDCRSPSSCADVSTDLGSWARQLYVQLAEAAPLDSLPSPLQRAGRLVDFFAEDVESASRVATEKKREGGSPTAERDAGERGRERRQNDRPPAEQRGVSAALLDTVEDLFHQLESGRRSIHWDEEDFFFRRENEWRSQQEALAAASVCQEEERRRRRATESAAQKAAEASHNALRRMQRLHAVAAEKNRVLSGLVQRLRAALKKKELQCDTLKATLQKVLPMPSQQRARYITPSFKITAPLCRRASGPHPFYPDLPPRSSGSSSITKNVNPTSIPSPTSLSTSPSSPFPSSSPVPASPSSVSLSVPGRASVSSVARCGGRAASPRRDEEREVERIRGLQEALEFCFLRETDLLRCVREQRDLVNALEAEVLELKAKLEASEERRKKEAQTANAQKVHKVPTVESEEAATHAEKQSLCSHVVVEKRVPAARGDVPQGKTEAINASVDSDRESSSSPPASSPPSAHRGSLADLVSTADVKRVAEYLPRGEETARVAEEGGGDFPESETSTRCRSRLGSATTPSTFFHETVKNAEGRRAALGSSSLESRARRSLGEEAELESGNAAENGQGEARFDAGFVRVRGERNSEALHAEQSRETGDGRVEPQRHRGEKAPAPEGRRKKREADAERQGVAFASFGVFEESAESSCGEEQGRDQHESSDLVVNRRYEGVCSHLKATAEEHKRKPSRTISSTRGCEEAAGFCQSSCEFNLPSSSRTSPCSFQPSPADAASLGKAAQAPQCQHSAETEKRKDKTERPREGRETRREEGGRRREEKEAYDAAKHEPLFASLDDVAVSRKRSNSRMHAFLSPEPPALWIGRESGPSSSQGDGVACPDLCNSYIPPAVHESTWRQEYRQSPRISQASKLESSVSRQEHLLSKQESSLSNRESEVLHLLASGCLPARVHRKASSLRSNPTVRVEELRPRGRGSSQSLDFPEAFSDRRTEVGAPMGEFLSPRQTTERQQTLEAAPALTAVFRASDSSDFLWAFSGLDGDKSPSPFRKRDKGKPHALSFVPSPAPIPVSPFSKAGSRGPSPSSSAGARWSGVSPFCASSSSGSDLGFR
ncbi:hypothetical protein TGP89_242670 [Toxoplasma gondii p89]|uniref:REJ domain-containing protein n=1 Tax=Toxoplasma gondii p89 TaxID=943119 RepID=A0A086JA28_TOXGO|nr:hypothetical protein TGP89_242670 [Toxoplasma gondii p89]